MQSYSYLVTGRVQGVGFRAYVADVADQMGLTGAVWNTSQGEVAVSASHESEEVLKRFEAQLWRGPGRVDNVARTEGSAYPIGSRFEIWPTR